MAHAAMTDDKTEIWRELRFNVLFKGDDWQGTEKGDRLERDFAAIGVALRAGDVEQRVAPYLGRSRSERGPPAANAA
jgi:hypothetical protein